MSDRELLQMAAKAAGIAIVRSRLDDPLQRDMLVNNSARNAHLETGPWNPLQDDGDALRLLARMPFCEFWVSDIGCTVFLPRKPAQVNLKCDEYANEHGGDLNAACRRAIVRAASELGKKA